MISGRCYGRGTKGPTKYIEFSEDREEGHGVIRIREDIPVSEVRDYCWIRDRRFQTGRKKEFPITQADPGLRRGRPAGKMPAENESGANRTARTTVL